MSPHPRRVQGGELTELQAELFLRAGFLVAVTSLVLGGASLVHAGLV